MAADVSKLALLIASDATQFLGGMDIAHKAAKDFQKHAEGSFRGVAAAGSQMGNAVKAAAAATAGALAAVGIAAFARDAVMAASDTSEAMNKVAVVFGDSASAVQAFAKNAAQSMGLSRNEALATAGTFGNLLTSMGLSQKAAAGMSTDILKLGADFASFNNIGVPEALEKIRAGLTGESEPLKDLGVNLNAAMIEAKALAMGFKEVDGELSAAAKAQATWALVLEQSKNAQGDFTNTSTGMANSMRIIEASFKDAQAEIGEKFLPLLAPLISNFAQALPGALETTRQVLSTVSDTITALVDGKGFDVLYDGFVKTFGPETAATIASIVDPLAKFRTDLLPGIVAFANGVKDQLVGAFDTLRNSGEAVNQWLRDHQAAIEGVGAVIGALATMQMARLIATLPSLIAQIAASTVAFGAQAVAAGAAAVALAAANLPIIAVGAALTGLILIGIQVVKNWDAVQKKAGELAAAATAKFAEIKSAIVDAFQGAWRIVEPIWNTIAGAIDGIRGFVRSMAGEDNALFKERGTTFKVQSLSKSLLPNEATLERRRFEIRRGEAIAEGMMAGLSGTDAAAAFNKGEWVKSLEKNLKEGGDAIGKAIAAGLNPAPLIAALQPVLDAWKDATSKSLAELNAEAVARMKADALATSKEIAASVVEAFKMKQWVENNNVDNLRRAAAQAANMAAVQQTDVETMRGARLFAQKQANWQRSFDLAFDKFLRGEGSIHDVRHFAMKSGVNSSRLQGWQAGGGMVSHQGTVSSESPSGLNMIAELLKELVLMTRQGQTITIDGRQVAEVIHPHVSYNLQEHGSVAARFGVGT